jgi:hypothetical protein
MIIGTDVDIQTVGVVDSTLFPAHTGKLVNSKRLGTLQTLHPDVGGGCFGVN